MLYPALDGLKNVPLSDHETAAREDLLQVVGLQGEQSRIAQNVRGFSVDEGSCGAVCSLQLDEIGVHKDFEDVGLVHGHAEVDI